MNQTLFVQFKPTYVIKGSWWSGHRLLIFQLSFETRPYSTDFTIPTTSLTCVLPTSRFCTYGFEAHCKLRISPAWRYVPSCILSRMVNWISWSPYPYHKLIHIVCLCKLLPDVTAARTIPTNEFLKKKDHISKSHCF